MHEIAKCFVQSVYPEIEIIAFVQRIQDIEAKIDLNLVTIGEVEESPIRCPDKLAEALMKERILHLSKEGG